MSSTNLSNRKVYIVDGARSPFLKATGKPGPFAAADLAVLAARELIARLPIEATDIEEAIFGCVMPSPDEVNIARIIAYRLGCGKKVPAYTVQRNCASGMQAIDEGMKNILLGRHDLVLVGGVDAMSHAPLLYNQKAVGWFAGMMAAKTPLDKIKQLLTWRPSLFFNPIIALMHGLSDPMVCMSMGQTAEKIAHGLNVSRTEMDAFAVESHQRLAAAMDAGYFKEEVIPAYFQNEVYTHDNGLRRDANIEKLTTLKPFFDKRFGAVTAGNSSQITDGATALILASEEAVKKYKLPVLGRIVDVNWAGLDPASMGLGPVYATTPLLERNGLKKEDIDYWEINEAFAAQVLSCLKAWESPEFCQKELGLAEAFGSLDRSRLNVDGGAIALGHPVGASGARIVLHLLNILKRTNTKRGMASICIGGGLGGAILLETV
jgi:acetyl-CoA C-acetyltransferase